MKIIGIVAEFNPFHNGHKYIIDYARNELNADYVIIAMSGDFVQRGTPAIFDKYVRTRAALLSGADAVFSIPVQLSTASASYYAMAGVCLLEKIGCTHILFGSESGNITQLSNAEYVKGSIDSPNNILGREYIHAIQTLDLNIIPVTVKRIGADYHNSATVCDGFSSATYIRNNFSSIFDSSNAYKNEWGISEEIYNLYCDYIKKLVAVDENMFSDILFSSLLTNQHPSYSKYFDVYDDLSEKISKHLFSYSSYSEFIDILKSKDIARSHISRALLHIMLGIDKNQISLLKEMKYVPYARLLGFNKNTNVINTIIDKATTDVIIKLSDYVDKCNEGIRNILNTDMQASHLYSKIASKNTPIHECSRKLITL